MMAATGDFHFVTFGAGQEWPQAAERLARQARATRIFASISVETGDTIFDRYPEFRRHASFVQANPRGWGYWLWKPFLIQQHLRRLPDGAVLLYLDAGCEIFPRNARKLAALLEIARDREAMILDYAELPVLNVAFWSKQSLLDKIAQDFASDIEQIRIPAVSAGTLAFRKTPRAQMLIEDWFSLASSDGYQYLDDAPSATPQRQLFFRTLHDQSILGLLVSHHRLETCGDALFYDYLSAQVDQWPGFLLRKPFLLMRNASGRSQVSRWQKLRAWSPFQSDNAMGRFGATKTAVLKLTERRRDDLTALGLG